MITKIIIKSIKFYQFFSKSMQKKCRFYPSCSEYMIQSINKYGLFIGLQKGIFRISKCHPWNPGGYDPV